MKYYNLRILQFCHSYSDYLKLLRYDLGFARRACTKGRFSDILQLLIMVVHSFAPFVYKIVHIGKLKDFK